MLHVTGRMWINKIAKIFNMYWSLAYRQIKEVAENLEEYKIKYDVKEIEFDEMGYS